MLHEASVPGSDDWWLVRLCNRLGEGLPRLGKLRSYRDGDALLPDAPLGADTRSILQFMKRSRLHVVETIRDSHTDRQGVIGFRTAAAGDEIGDQAAWSVWRGNRMGTQQRSFFNDTADFGRSYIAVAPNPDGIPVWGVKNEWTTITEQDELRPWLTRAGISVGYDYIAGVETVILYRAGEGGGESYWRVAIRRTSIPTLPTDGSPWSSGNDWEWASPPQYTGNGIQDALLVQNRTPDGFGLWEKHLDTVDRINEITLNALTLIVMQSYRQRAISGDLPEYYPEGHPQAGEPVNYEEMFKAGPAALWMLPDGAKMWESGATDVRPIYDARREEVKTLSSITRTPQDIFDGQSNNQSALGAQVSREPLYFSVNGMNGQAAEAFAQAQALSFALTGDSVRADSSQVETIFQKIVPPTLAEQAEAAPKFKAGGASQRFIDAEVFAMTPQEQRRVAAERADDAFEAALSQPVTVPQRASVAVNDAGQ